MTCNSNHLIVFARIPHYGRVKTRLSKSVGCLEARRYYKAILTRNLRELSGDSRWDCWLAITPDRGTFVAPNLRRWRVFNQGLGNLGDRMLRALMTVPPGPAVLVGSDLPQLGCRQVKCAFDALRNHDLVFGPATDGGYWLIGARRRPGAQSKHLANLFDSVRWSTSNALADTLRNTKKSRVAILEVLQDVDNVYGYKENPV